MHKAIN